MKTIKPIEQLRRKEWVTIFVIYLRYLIGGAFVFSSIVKIRGARFTTDDGTSAPINSAWHLFETLYQSGVYWSFLGWSQLIAGLLLMTQRYATLGALLFFPITVNIFFITISYYFAATPVITGLLLLANIFLLLWDYQKLLPLINFASKHEFKINNKAEERLLWTYVGVLMFLITVIYVTVSGRNPNLWIIISVLTGLSTLLLYMASKRNNANN